MKCMKWRGSVVLSFVGTVTGTFPVFVIRRQGDVKNFRDEKDADSAVEAWASTEGSLAYRGVDMENNQSATFFSIFVLTSKCLFLTKLNISGCSNVDADVALLGALVNLVELEAGQSGLKGERGRGEEVGGAVKEAVSGSVAPAHAPPPPRKTLTPLVPPSRLPATPRGR